MEITNNIEQVEQTTGVKKEWSAPELKIAALYERTAGAAAGTIESPTSNS